MKLNYSQMCEQANTQAVEKKRLQSKVEEKNRVVSHPVFRK
jgi:hypothetical protein